MTDIDVDKIVQGLAAKGLAIVPAALMDDALQSYKARQCLLRRSKVTVYEAAKFKLLPKAPTSKTIKAMAADGRILDHEHFVDASGKHYITAACIKRLNTDV